MKKEIPITLITGYLGSGKTTLINHILQNENQKKIAVIVNDIGEVNIDETLIEQGGVVNKKDSSLVALTNGCICCNLKMDLVEQINEIIAQDKFDAIVINPAAYTHTSIAILDALKAVALPAVEVHISDVDAREPFRQVSYPGMYCEMTIKGQGLNGYVQAIEYLCEKYR